MLCMQAATRILWTNRAGAGTRMIDGLNIRGGSLGLGHRRGRELFEATVDGSGGTKASHRIRQRQRWTHFWAVYGSVRGCIQGHSDLAVVVQHMEWQRLGVKVRQGPRQELQCTMDRESRIFEQFDAVRSQDCIRSVMQDAN